MEKISINLVGGVAGDADYGLRLYNVGNGFVGFTGKVVSRTHDSMYLGFSSERAYTVAVEGDLVLSTETNDSFVDKTDGVYGFDIDWSDAAKNFGNGTGKIIVTNPDSPSDVSVVEVFMGDTPSAVVEFKPNTGNNGTVVIREELDVSAVDPVMKKLLKATDFSDPYGLGIECVAALLPVLEFDYGRLFDVTINRTEKSMTNPKDNEGEGIIDVLIVDGPTMPLETLKTLLDSGVQVFVVGDSNMPAGDATRIADENAFFAGVGLGERIDHPFWGRDGIAPVLVSGLSDLDVLAHEVHRPSDVLGFERIEHAVLPIGPMAHDFDLPFGGHAGAVREPFMDIISMLPARAFCAHNHAGDCALVDAMLEGFGVKLGLEELPEGLERATLKDLMDSYGDDGVKVGGDKRDFGQLAGTRQNDINSIARAVAAADALGIDTSDIASKRDELLAKLAVFSDRFEVGGTHEVTTDEAAVINTVFGELFGIHQELDSCVSHWHHYKQQIEESHNRWSAGLASRKRSYRLADDAQDNRIATSYVDYAAAPEETLEASKTAMVELFQAIQRRDLREASFTATKARQFSTREHMLASLIRRNVLVPVEESGVSAAA